MATYSSLLGCIDNFDAALNEKVEEEEEEEEQCKPKWSLEELEAQYAADAKKKKKKKKKPAPEKKAPPKKEEKPKPKVKTKKDTIENLKKYLDKEEDREKKIDYDNIIRPTEPIRNFQDIARKTAALAKLDNNNDDEEGARRRAGELVKTKSSWSLLAGHFKAKTLFEDTRADDDSGEQKLDGDSVDLPPGDTAEDLMWLRKWLDKEDERQDRRIAKLGEMAEDGEDALPPLTFQMTKEAQAREMTELVNQIKEKQAKDPNYKRKIAAKTSQPTQAPLSKHEIKMQALAGKSTHSTCSHGGMCIHMIRALAVMEAKETAKEKHGTNKWT